MSCMKRVWRRMLGNKPMRVLLLGLDAAGKTTILYQLMGKGESTVPTIGFNVETIKVPPLEFLVWDVSGQDRLRSFWRHYYHGTTGIVFVVDSHDVERLPIARKELHGILKEEELSGAVLLIVANKMDLPQSVSVEQLRDALELQTLGDRVMHIQPAVAQTGKGLKEGLMWLAKAMKQQSKQRGGAVQAQANTFTSTASASASGSGGVGVAQSPNPVSYASSASSSSASSAPAHQPTPLATQSSVASSTAPLHSVSSSSVNAGAVLTPAVLSVVPPSALSASSSSSSSAASSVSVPTLLAVSSTASSSSSTSSSSQTVPSSSSSASSDVAPSSSQQPPPTALTVDEDIVPGEAQ